MRKRKPQKRYYQPDPRFGDENVTFFVNNLMLDGKKTNRTDRFLPEKYVGLASGVMETGWSP